MLPVALLKVAPLFLSLRIVYAVLPSGDIERTLFKEVPEGMQALTEHQSARTGVKELQRRLLPRGRYGWRIEEERRSVVLATPGRPTGVVRRAFALSAWIDATPNPNVAPHPVQAFQFYAPTREAAEALRERLKEALGTKRQQSFAAANPRSSVGARTTTVGSATRMNSSNGMSATSPVLRNSSNIARTA